MDVGVVLPHDLAADEVLLFAGCAEELGFSSVWVIEDLGFLGGFAQAGAVLASTGKIRVGLGVAPAAARNAAFAAMEAATLAKMFPGRFTFGIGHGVPAWMQQAGAWPPSPLGLLAEHLDAIRRLLRGETVSMQGRYVWLDEVRLNTPPLQPPVIAAGVRGPRSLALSGSLADATLLTKPATPEYIRQARAQIGVPAHQHRLYSYELAAVGVDVDNARDLARPELARVGDAAAAAHIRPSSYAERLWDLRKNCSDADDFARRLPAPWVDDLALVGTPERVRARIADLYAAGLDEVIVFPIGPDRLHALRDLAVVLG